MATIGFIGLGRMGSGMAANLAKAGYKVLAYDVSADALEQARKDGCKTVDHAAATAEGASAIITMLPFGRHVAQLWRETLFDAARPETILIDCSTIDVAVARELAEEAAEHGLETVDAPVSGGIAAARAGTLSVMVGGSEQAFAHARPFLQAIGKTVIHAGGIGSGLAARLCNSLMMGAAMIATCEAFALAEKLGLDLKTFYDIAAASSGQSWSVTSYCPVPGVGPETPADHDYEEGFAAAFMLKDLRLAAEAATRARARIPMSTRTRELYERFVAEENPQTDFSAMYRRLK